MGDFTVKYTNKNIMDKLQEQDNTLNEILNHAKETNGRVTVLETKSIGMWVSNNPFKFVLFVILFIAMVISDFRHPLMNLFTSLIKLV